MKCSPKLGSQITHFSRVHRESDPSNTEKEMYVATLKKKKSPMVSHRHVTSYQPHPVHLYTLHSTLLMQTLHTLCLFATVDHLTLVVMSLHLKRLHQSHDTAFRYGFNFFPYILLSSLEYHTICSDHFYLTLCLLADKYVFDVTSHHRWIKVTAEPLLSLGPM